MLPSATTARKFRNIRDGKRDWEVLENIIFSIFSDSNAHEPKWNVHETLWKKEDVVEPKHYVYLNNGVDIGYLPQNTVSLQSRQKSISQVHFWDKMDLCPSLVRGSPLWQLTRKVGRDSGSSTHQARVAPRPQKSPNCRTLWSLESANWIILGDFAASFPGNRPLIYFTHACNPCLTMCSHTKVGTLRRTLNSCVGRGSHQLQT